MAEPELVEGTPYDVNFIFNAGRDGFSESYVLMIDGVADPYESAMLWIASYADGRRKVLHENLTLEAARVSSRLVSHDSRRSLNPDRNLGAGLVTAAPAPFKDGFYVITRDPSQNVMAQRGFGGLANTDLSLGTARGADRLRPDASARVTAWVNKLRELLVGNQVGAGNPGTVLPVIPSYDRTPDAGPKHEIKTWDTDADGWLKLTLRTGTPTWVQGDKIHLTHKRTTCVKGLQGVHEVISNEGSVDGQVIRLATKLHCNKAALLGMIGWLQLRSVGYYEIGHVHFGIYGERVVGGAFFRQAGRQKGKH